MNHRVFFFKPLAVQVVIRYYIVCIWKNKFCEFKERRDHKKINIIHYKEKSDKQFTFLLFLSIGKLFYDHKRLSFAITISNMVTTKLS